MTQLKIIRIRGQCRGRPPTEVGSRQSAVGSLSRGAKRRGIGSQQSAARGSPFAVLGMSREVKRRGIGSSRFAVRGSPFTVRNPEQFAVRGSPFAVRIQETETPIRESSLPLSALSALVVNTIIMNPEPGTRNSKYLRTQHPLARAWPNSTCSAMPVIGQNRNNDRWKTTLNLLKNSEEGVICLFADRIEVNNCNSA